MWCDAASILLARVEDGGAGGGDDDGCAFGRRGGACWYQDYMLPKGWVDEHSTP